MQILNKPNEKSFSLHIPVQIEEGTMTIPSEILSAASSRLRVNGFFMRDAD